jgi:hypothetical protein
VALDSLRIISHGASRLGVVPAGKKAPVESTALRLKNTSRYPTDEVRQLVEFGMRGVRTERLEVHVKNSADIFGGMAYHGVPSISTAYGKATVDRLVTIRIGAPERFPHTRMTRYVRAPVYDLRDWREAMVMVAAHEGRHIQQMQRKRSLSEVDCIKFEAARVAEFRATQHIEV